MGRQRSKFLITQTLVFVVWCVILLLFADFGRWLTWVGIGCTALAYGVSMKSLLLYLDERDRVNVDVGFLAVIVTEGYAVAVYVMNTVFVLAIGTGVKWLFAGNVVALGVFAVARMGTDTYFRNLTAKTQHVAERANRTQAISTEVSSLLAFATEADVKKGLLRLKEAVDLGEGLASNGSWDTEEKFLTQLARIKEGLTAELPKEETLKRIDEADRIWQMRASLRAGRM